MGDLTRVLKERRLDIHESPIPAPRLAGLVRLLASGAISGKIAKDVFEAMLAEGRDAEVIVRTRGLNVISDEGALRAIVVQVVGNFPAQAEQYRGGKTTVLGFFVGQVMKATGGQASPELANRLVREVLGGL